MGPSAAPNENTRLKKIVANLTLDREMLGGTSSAESSFASLLKPVTPAGSYYPERVDGMLVDGAVSIRRACEALRLNCRATTTSPAKPGRPHWNGGPGKSAKRGCAAAVAAFTSFSTGKAGRPASRWSITFTGL